MAVDLDRREYHRRRGGGVEYLAVELLQHRVVGRGAQERMRRQEGTVLTPVTRSNCGRVPRSVQPFRKPAPKAPNCPPPESSRTLMGRPTNASIAPITPKLAIVGSTRLGSVGLAPVGRKAPMGAVLERPRSLGVAQAASKTATATAQSRRHGRNRRGRPPMPVRPMVSHLVENPPPPHAAPCTGKGNRGDGPPDDVDK